MENHNQAEKEKGDEDHKEHHRHHRKAGSMIDHRKGTHDQVIALQEENRKLREKVRKFKRSLRHAESQLKSLKMMEDSGSSDDSTPRQKNPYGNTKVTKDAICFTCKRAIEGKREKMRLIVIAKAGVTIAKQYSEEVEHQFPWGQICGWTLSDEANLITFTLMPNAKTKVRYYYTYAVEDAQTVNHALGEMVFTLTGKRLPSQDKKPNFFMRHFANLVGPPDKPGDKATANVVPASKPAEASEAKKD